LEISIDPRSLSSGPSKFWDAVPLWLASFALTYTFPMLTLALVMWVLISEVFPNRGRSQGISAAVSTLNFQTCGEIREVRSTEASAQVVSS